MPDKVNGLHHVTMFAGDPRAHDAFYREALGLRRVKVTVNFDAPDVYHLYYGDAAGTPGSVMTYFPFPHIAKGRHGTGEVGETVFAIPQGSLGFWKDRLGGEEATSFGETRLRFTEPDGDQFALVETGDAREGWTGSVDADHSVRGFRGASLRLRDGGATGELVGKVTAGQAAEISASESDDEQLAEAVDLASEGAAFDSGTD